MLIRLERLRVEPIDSPMMLCIIGDYLRELERNAPNYTLEPILVEECGADRHGRLYIIRDGKYQFLAAILAGRKDIVANYKGVEQRASSTKGSSVNDINDQASDAEFAKQYCDPQRVYDYYTSFSWDHFR